MWKAKIDLEKEKVYSLCKLKVVKSESELSVTGFDVLEKEAKDAQTSSGEVRAVHLRALRRFTTTDENYNSF